MSPQRQPDGGPDAPNTPEHVRVAVIGAGFGGLGAAIRLRREGVTDFVILERAGAVGGTWRENDYPGAGCDVPSHLYSFSFAPNPDWSRVFSGRDEIRAYLERVTDDFGLRSRLRLHHDVRMMTWDEDALLWRIETTGGDLTADVVVSAAGPLTEGRIPDIPGIDGFPGEIFHSSRWNHGAELRGQRIAVVGSGASAVQIVPRIQPEAARLMVFQRTPSWVLPKGDRPVTAVERWLHRRVPATAKARRAALWAVRELLVGSFTRHPGRMRRGEDIARAQLARHVRDPELRAALTPSYRMGCKRILLSNDFHPALTRPNTTLVPSALAEIRGSTLIAADGTETEADVIVFCTGFRTAGMPVAERIRGIGGVLLADHWKGGVRALRGTAVDGFPNLLTVIGPNTGVGNTSMVLIIEAQLNYLADYLRRLSRLGPGRALVARAGAVAAWGELLDRRMRKSVWTTGGCDSWYLDESGRNTTLWPGSATGFRRAVREVDPGEYEILRRAPAEPAPPAARATPVQDPPAEKPPPAGETAGETPEEAAV
ncbi:NAD(P)/FAD-dependent oxidoreductase [Streptomyces sp. NPDC020875]|uniref:flavin-containing monooxygenase n=1 Tax=Streptomyces sp. NPDC020875 TaxID=3154898 RepID=UPI0033E49CD4